MGCFCVLRLRTAWRASSGLRANNRHTLFRPIRESALKTDGLADVLRDALGTAGIDFALVYGSIAAAEPRVTDSEAVELIAAVSELPPLAVGEDEEWEAYGDWDGDEA